MKLHPLGIIAKRERGGIPYTARRLGRKENTSNTLVPIVANSLSQGTCMETAKTASAITIAKRLSEEGGYEVKVKSITYAGKADVFNMEVEDTHDFVIQGGVIAHNCPDEVRYMCMSRPIKPIIPVERKIILSDPLDQYKKKTY